MAATPPILAAGELRARLERGEVRVLDVRPLVAYLGGHVPGSASVPYIRGRFTPMVQALVPEDPPLVVLADGTALAAAAVRELEAAGRMVAATFPGGLPEWQAGGGPVESTAMIEAGALQPRIGEPGLTVVDVREPHEWAAGTIPGARRIPLGELAQRLPEIDRDGTCAVVCASGSRSLQAAWWLQQNGYARVMNVLGGMDAWEDAGLPTE